jgi:hypothetical protein
LRTLIVLPQRIAAVRIARDHQRLFDADRGEVQAERIGDLACLAQQGFQRFERLRLRRHIRAPYP